MIRRSRQNTISSYEADVYVRKTRSAPRVSDDAIEKLVEAMSWPRIPVTVPRRLTIGEIKAARKLVLGG